METNQSILRIKFYLTTLILSTFNLGWVALSELKEPSLDKPLVLLASLAAIIYAIRNILKIAQLAEQQSKA